MNRRHFLLVSAAGAGMLRAEPQFEDFLVVPMVPHRTHRGATGSMVELKDGSVLFAYANPEHWTDNTHSGVVGRISHDRGRSWGDAFVMQKHVARLGTLGPSLLRLKSGEILFGYNVMNRYEGSDLRLYDGKYYVRRSFDEGKTWDDPMCATPYQSYHTVNPDQMIQLSTGRIIVPAECTREIGGGEAGHMASLCYWSDDGHGWIRSKNYVDVGSTTEEPSIVELKDGRLFMVFRNKSGYVGRAYSNDQGDTWTDVGYLSLPSPLAPQSIKRIPKTGDLLLLWLNNTDAPGLAKKQQQPILQIGEIKRAAGAVRAPLTAAISRDEGKTWEHIRNLTSDPKGDYGYVGVAFVDDVALVNYHSLLGIHVARVKIDWFYGK
jgi:sialidase-1